MKRILYMCPVDWMRGKLSGNQVINYDGGKAYDVTEGDRVAATGYAPRVIAQLRKKGTLRSYQVRTKTTVNATAAYRINLALMGGACAMYSAIIRDKSSNLYSACVEAYNAGKTKGDTLRSYLVKKFRSGLEEGNTIIFLDNNVEIDNPWTTEKQSPNVVVSDNIINKFNEYLS